MELEEEVARECGMNSAPAELSSSTYATALEEEVVLGYRSMEEDGGGDTGPYSVVASEHGRRQA
jgi:hypothetical protein